MQMSPRRLVGFVCLSLLAMTACSGPSGPQPGTPAYAWESAKSAFDEGDYQRTADNLEKVAGSESEYAAPAAVWRVILLSGITQGYQDLADSYEYGARNNKQNPTPFRRYMADYRSAADRQAVRLAEAFQQFRKTNTGDGPVTLAFGFPKGSAAPIADLDEVSKGYVPSDEQAKRLEKRAIERAVVLAVSAAAGAAKDPAKALELFKAREVQTPRADFQLALAEQMRDVSGLYARKKLNRPERMKVFAENALALLGKVPASDKTKKLQAEIEDMLKAPRG